MSGVPQDDTLNISPIRTQPNDNLNVSPNREQGSPHRPQKESSSPLPLVTRNQSPGPEIDEYDLFGYKTEQLVEVKRSDYIAPIELVAQQDKYLRSIEVEGILGTRPVKLNKAQLLSDRLDSQANLQVAPSHGSSDYLKKDGIFVENDEEIRTLVNMQRLEQRLFWENKKEWFRKDNGELIQDSQIFNERITKMRDVSITRNPNLSIIKKNAYLSERENQKKTQYFKLDILVGKIYITKHPLFINEDEKAVVLKSLVKDYKEKADLTLIPHLRKQLEQLNVEHQKLASKYDIPPKEIEVIEKEIRLVQSMLEKETISLQTIMENIYKTWEEIKKVRTDNNFSSTTVRLNVRQYKSEEFTNEFELFLSPQEYSKASDFSGRMLPYHERSRRQRIAQFKVWVGIYINGVYVGRTKKVFLEWPSFEVNFLEKFQIYLFRKPATIEFRIYMGTFRSIQIDSVMIDIPGENANTLTSSSTIYREKSFAKRIQTQPTPNTTKTPVKSPPANNSQPDVTLNKDKSQSSPVKDQKNPEDLQKSPIAGNLNLSPEKDNQSNNTESDLSKSPIAGIIFYKAEWFGYGTSLPPPTIEKFGGKKQEGIKVKNYYEQSLENLVDINDPRNELAIQQLKKLKNQQIQEVLKRDAMMPFSEIESLRHRLYKLKFQKIDLAMKRIPLTEKEIFNNNDFMRFINEYERELQELENEGEYQSVPLLKENLIDVDKFPYSIETRKRIVKYRKRLYVRQQEIQSQRLRDVGNILSLKAVVNEFYFEEGINPIAEFFKSVFAQRGKLRPLRKTQHKVKAERTEKADILVHIIKGKDIPARAKAAGQVKAFREQAFVPAFQTTFSPRGFNNYPGYSNYPNPNYPNPNYPNYPNFNPNNSGQGNYPPPNEYGGYGNYPGPNGSFNNMGPYPGQEGYPQDRSMRSPPRDQSAHDMIPGYYPGYSPRLGQDPYGNPYGNEMNPQQYRSGTLPDNLAMRQAMSGNFDTRMAIQGGMPNENVLVERVLPFLEIKLHDPDKGTLYTVKTETFEGTYPEWNDNLQIPLKISREDLDYDITSNPENTRAVVYFNLFDLVSSVNRHKESTNKYNVLIEKRYLGSFSIPLATLFQYPQQNAVYKIERPLFLFGYFNMKPVFSADLQISSLVADPFTPSYVTLSLTIDPPLDMPTKNVVDYYSGAENPQLLLNGTNWLKNLKKNNKYANRNIKLWGNGINKMAQLESRFIPRYLTPLVPPIDVIDENAYTKAARYVSLIPTRNDTFFFKDLPELWSTCQEFLDIQAGGHEEHAILLCNYFTYIDQQLKKDNIKNYLLLGKAVPEGETVYVLRRNIQTNDVEIWNASYGDPYFFKRKTQAFNCFYLFSLNSTSMLDREISDNEYPLQEIGCVISSENVWVNIQPDVTPSHVIFDIENKKNWMPFLGEKSYTRYFPTKQIETIQTELKYEKTPTEFVQRLEKKIQSEIAKRIEQERSSLENGKRAYRTKWERRFGDRLRNILLTSFESFKYRTRTTGTKSTMAEVQNITKSKEDIEQIKDDILNEVPEGGDIYGFPLNMPYTNIDKIWQEVKNTDIHNIQNDDVEYVLAVGVYAYDHFVLSVWIFVGVIFNKPIKAR